MNGRRRGYPLGALFVVVAACAVLIAGVSPLIRSLFRGEANVGHFLESVVTGAGCGLLVGAVMGGNLPATSFIV